MDTEDNCRSVKQLLQLSAGCTRKIFTRQSDTSRRFFYTPSIYLQWMCSEAKVVVIHDAVRPFIDEETVRAVVKAALQSGAAGVVRPLVSTVVATDLEGYLDHSLDRSKYRSSEMPQAFALDVILQAYEKSTDYDMDYGTECLHLVQRYAGVKVQLVDGSEHLWKVTYKRDLYTVEGIVKAALGVCLVFRGNQDTDIQTHIERYLLSKHEDSIFLVTCVNEELEQLSCSRQLLLNSVIICHNCAWTPDEISASTYDVNAKLEGSMKRHTVLTVVHLLLSDCHSNENVLLIMSAVKKCRGDGRLINAVLSNTEGMSKAIDIICSLIKDQNQSFDGQTFVV